MNALYNEIEPFACDWLDSLIAAGHIAPGRVERRSIAELTPADVAGHGQRHFFAGIGVWSYALRLAGVPDDADIWTGSCPCQPFSSAGKGLGVRDPRHLWPTWFALIEQCRPPVIFGEQVASKDGLAWLDLVFADLERRGYSVGAADLCAAGVSAPHARQRLYFVAVADNDTARRRLVGQLGLREDRDAQRRDDAHGCGAAGGMADAVLAGRTQGRPKSGNRSAAGRHSTSKLGNADVTRREDPGIGRVMAPSKASGPARVERDNRTPYPGPTRNPWEPCEWIPCRDPQHGIVYRPVESGTFPLAHGAPARVGRLRGYGNGLVSEQAATFIEAALDAIGGL